MRKFVFRISMGLFFLTLFLVSGCSKTNEPAVTKYIGWAVGMPDNSYGTIIYTDNDGLTWSRQGSPTLTPDITIFDVSAMSDQEVWVVGGSIDGYGLIYHSTSGGGLWIREGSSEQIPDAAIRAVFAADSHSAWFAGDNKTILYTSDDGNTFTKYMPDSIPLVNFTSIALSGSSKIWLVGNPSARESSDTIAVVVHSPDAGVTWIRQGKQSGLPVALYDVNSANDSVVYIAGHGGVFKSLNGGLSWQRVL
jgi:photosystem II stability/assembly factor-like uncharacterized protein